MTARLEFAAFGLGIALAGLPVTLGAQEPRLTGRLPVAARAQVDSILEAARSGGLPTEPLVDRALEGAAKGAAPRLIVAAVSRLGEELRAAARLAEMPDGRDLSTRERQAGQVRQVQRWHDLLMR